jgi:hypothetical protein
MDTKIRRKSQRWFREARLCQDFRFGLQARVS